MKKRFMQLKTSYVDLMSILRQFKMRVFKFFGIDKLIKIKQIKYLIRLFKMTIKIVILFKLSLFIIKSFSLSQ